MDLTPTKLIVRLKDGSDVKVVIMSEHEYQLEAIEEALRLSSLFKDCDIVYSDREYDEEDTSPTCRPIKFSDVRDQPIFYAKEK